MRSTTFASLPITLLFTFLTSLAFAAQPERNIDVFAWPLSAPQAQSLASIGYTSTNATLKRYTAPAVPADEEIVRIGFYHPSGSWSGVATAASNFVSSSSSSKRTIYKTILLHLNGAGELFHVGLQTSNVPSSGSGKTSTSHEEGVNVEIVMTQPGPVPLLNKPVVLNEQGQVDDKVPEKSFFQKYWWVMALFLVFQVVMGGGGGKEEK